MNLPSSIRVFTSVFRPISIPTRQFSSTPIPLKGKKKVEDGRKRDVRISLIRQHLWHPLTPRPLRLSRNRSLRHWTINRAWEVYSKQQARKQELELERQWNAMRAACERLRVLGDDGVDGGRGMGRLFRQSMEKAGTWQGVPIEGARILSHYPSREGWNHEWKAK